jgi:cytochrome c-type biogenesis protein CcsB
MSDIEQLRDRNDLRDSRGFGEQRGVIARWWLPLLAAAAVLGLAALFASSRGERDAMGGTQGFAAQVDLRPLDEVAVQAEGRLKSFDSFADSTMFMVSGSKRIAGQSPSFTYLDILFRPGAYEDADVIYVKNKAARAQMAEAMSAARPELRERMEAFTHTGLISERIVLDPAMRPLIGRLQADLIRTEKVVSALNGALAVKQPETLLARLRLLPPPDGDPERRWHGVDELLPQQLADGSVGMRPIAGMDPSVQQQLAAHWADLVNGWGRQDPVAVNAAVAAFAAILPTIDSAGYPSDGRLRMESWYFAVDHMSWVWLAYMFGVLPLLMWAVYRWPTALRLGLAIFIAAFLLQTASVGIRWYISGRWPNSNMFEAVTTASWFGACAALLIEAIASRSAMRGLFALGASVASMIALMAAHFLPAYLNPQIGNMMPVLNDVWLYIHTNVIIFSYCLIFMAAVSAMLYLLWRLFGGGPDYARVGGAGTLIMGEHREKRRAVAERVATVQREAVAERGLVAALPGFGAVPIGGGGGGIGREPAASERAAAATPARVETTAASMARRASPGEIFDGVTMVLMESSFVLLWAGIVMGAIWADHSWGRPWGWDPKEVFALNTFLVFAILVHVRIKAKDKGLWTAILAVAGAGVMLFNWIVINFVITGLHSYA